VTKLQQRAIEPQRDRWINLFLRRGLNWLAQATFLWLANENLFAFNWLIEHLQMHYLKTNNIFQLKSFWNEANAVQCVCWWYLIRTVLRTSIKILSLPSMFNFHSMILQRWMLFLWQLGCLLSQKLHSMRGQNYQHPECGSFMILLISPKRTPLLARVYWFFLLYPLSSILNNTTFQKLDVFPSPQLRGWETPTLLRPLEITNPNHCSGYSHLLTWGQKQIYFPKRCVL
jgi:hypothetical protein